MSPNTIRTAIAQRVGAVPVATTETRIVPAIAVPKEEPRFEMLRDSPEISPCSASGKLDCTTFTEGVSMAPRPRPTSASPGTNAQTLSEARTRPSRIAIPAMVTTKPATINVRLGVFLREALRSEGGEEDAERGCGEDDAGLDRAVAANLLQEDGDRRTTRPSAAATGCSA